MNIKSWEKTCDSFPTQYEGVYEDGQPFYFRYRFGLWHVRSSFKSNAVEFGHGLEGDEYDGEMEEARVMELVEGAR